MGLVNDLPRPLYAFRLSAGATIVGPVFGLEPPPAFHNRLSRGLRPGAPPAALPYPILRCLPRARFAALCLAVGRCGGRPRGAGGRSRGGNATRPCAFPPRSRCTAVSGCMAPTQRWGLPGRSTPPRAAAGNCHGPLAPKANGISWRHSRRRSWPFPPPYTLPESPQGSAGSWGRWIRYGDNRSPTRDCPRR